MDVTSLLDPLRPGLGTALQAAATRDGVPLVHVATGTLAPGGPAITASTPFDLASLTKVTTTLATARLVDAGVLTLDQTLGSLLPEAAAAHVTLRQLLGHRSGLPAWAPWFDAARTPGGPWGRADGTADTASLTRQAILAVPAGAPQRLYSDAGFLLLGFALEAAASMPLDALVDEEVLAPLGMTRTRYHRRSTGQARPAPPTGTRRPRPPAPGQEGLVDDDPSFDEPTTGLVDDDNAWALDGVAGHAGLFGPADDVLALGHAVLHDLDGAERLVRHDVMAAFVAPDAPSLPPLRSLGFDRPSGPRSSLGDLLGRGPAGAVGHLGFTGTSLWIDLDQRLVAVLLTARVFPDRSVTEPIRTLRRAFHDALALTR